MKSKEICFVVVILFLAFTYSCSDDGELKGDNVYKNNFENIDGWFENSQIIQGNAHSGQYFCKVSPENPYSITFRKKIKALNVKSIDKIKISAWVKFPDLKAKADVCVEIDSVPGTKPFFWMGVHADDFITEPDKWSQITTEVKMPENISDEYILVFYLANAAKQPVYVDDLSFQLIEKK